MPPWAQPKRPRTPGSSPEPCRRLPVTWTARWPYGRSPSSASAGKSRPAPAKRATARSSRAPGRWASRCRSASTKSGTAPSDPPDSHRLGPRRRRPSTVPLVSSSATCGGKGSESTLERDRLRSGPRELAQRRPLGDGGKAGRFPDALRPGELEKALDGVLAAVAGIAEAAEGRAQEGAAVVVDHHHAGVDAPGQAAG